MITSVGALAAQVVRDYENCVRPFAFREPDPTADVRLSPERFPDPGSLLAARLPVAALALGAVAAVGDAADRARGLRAPGAPLRADRVAASFCSDRMLRFDGEPMSGFAELSGFFAASGGWVRTHANYPHHRERLLALLGLGADADRTALARAVADRDPVALEQAAADAGALVVAVRTEEQWRGHDAGKAASALPLVTTRLRDDAGAAAATTPPTSARDAGAPLHGVRVLDLTRVIAGPVATRDLALLGAEVLRIDPPQLPELAAQQADTGQGKRSAVLDLHSPQNAELFAELLVGADVLVTGYRPSSLERLGVAPAAHQIHATVSAWGTNGPWAPRRGFDSLVQAASGIALIEADDDRPGALPAQALDHASGHLLAAAVIDALLTREHDGRGRDVAVSLAGTAAWLLSAPGRRADRPPATLPGPDTVVTHDRYTTARPALADHDDHPWPAHLWGADDARWPSMR